MNLVEDDPGKTITTAQDVRTGRTPSPRLLFVVPSRETGPPPSHAPPRHPSTRPELQDRAAWQYAQSPLRPENTRTCRKTYATDNNVAYAQAFEKSIPHTNVAISDDPSHGPPTWSLNLGNRKRDAKFCLNAGWRAPTRSHLSLRRTNRTSRRRPPRDCVQRLPLTTSDRAFSASNVTSVSASIGAFAKSSLCA